MHPAIFGAVAGPVTRLTAQPLHYASHLSLAFAIRSCGKCETLSIAKSLCGGGGALLERHWGGRRRKEGGTERGGDQVVGRRRLAYFDLACQFIVSCMVHASAGIYFFFICQNLLNEVISRISRRMPPLQEAKWDLGEDDAPGILSRGKEEAELAFGLLLQMSGRRRRRRDRGDRNGYIGLCTEPAGIPISDDVLVSFQLLLCKRLTK